PEMSSEPDQKWHAKEALEAEQSGRWYAALFHLTVLIAAQPDDTGLLRRRGEALGRLGQTKRAAADFSRLREQELLQQQAMEKIAVLAAWERDQAAYNAVAGRMMAFIKLQRGRPMFQPFPDHLSLIVLAPAGAHAPRLREALELADNRLASSPGDWVWLS